MSGTSHPAVSLASTPLIASFSHQTSGTVSASSQSARRYVSAVRLRASSADENVIGLRIHRVGSASQWYGTSPDRRISADRRQTVPLHSFSVLATTPRLTSR